LPIIAVFADTEIGEDAAMKPTPPRRSDSLALARRPRRAGGGRLFLKPIMAIPNPITVAPDPRWAPSAGANRT
jgi:hypothetical protein